MSVLAARAADLARLADERWDLIIVGGGIVGCGALLDATSRGLRAALVEQDDIGVGTSSRSSRLIHGGLRYLEHYQFRLVREALRERSRLLRLAPHLVRLEPFLFPVYGMPLVHRAFYGAGLTLYDILGAARDGGRSRHLGARATLERTPALRHSGLRGGIVYHDGVEDDARLTLAVARTAVAQGGLVLTRLRATGLLTGSGGRVAGIRARDTLAGEELEVRADHVLDATGVWAGRPDASLGGSDVHIVPSRGSHLVVPRERLPLSMGLSLRVPRKVVFIIPWPDAWLIGTTDEPDAGPPDRPVPSDHEVRGLLETVNAYLEVDLRRDEVVGAFAGLRPLVTAPGGDTVRASREHRVGREESGLARVSGGKYTTYRVMARDAVDCAIEDGRERHSATESLALVGAAPRAALDRLADDLSRRTGLEQGTTRTLVDRHGTDAADVVALGEASGLLRPLISGRPELEAEVAWAVRQEMALALDDVLARRMRLAMRLPDRGEAIAGRVAAIMGPEIGWDDAAQAEAVRAYLASAHREYDVPAGETVAAAVDAGARSPGRRGEASSPAATPDR